MIFLTTITAIFIFLWLIKTGKTLLFWIYLLQIKEYKWKRLIDHFQTEKGKELLMDKSLVLKISVFITLIYTHEFVGDWQMRLWIFWIMFTILGSLYLLESAIAIKKARSNTLKLPKFTKNASVITIATFSAQIGFIVSAAILNLPALQTLSAILLFDIISPLVAIAVVAALKPIDAILKKRLFEKAKNKRESLKDLLVIGIVGSYGKTSTKEFLYEILKNKFNVIKTEAHENTEVAIANLIINKLTNKHEIFICEMGAYEAGEIKTITEMVKPKIGVFLGANEQHLSLFGTMKDLLRGEGGEELLELLPKGSLGIFNGNNTYSYELYKKANIAKRITYSPNLVEIINPDKRDVRAENITVSKDNIKFRIVSNKDSKGSEFKANLLGAHNIENILLAAAVGEELGLTLQEISSAIKNVKPMEKTMTLTKSKSGINIINSTYSSNPSAVRAHLEYLKTWENAKKIIIMPCLIELGQASPKIHRQVGKWLAETGDLAVITTGDQFAEIEKGVKESNKKNLELINTESAEAIIEKLKSFTKKGDVILLEGRLPESLIKEISSL